MKFLLPFAFELIALLSVVPIAKTRGSTAKRGGAAARTPSTWVCRHCGAVNARTALVCRNRC